jgi:hypothetical protein
VLTPIEVSSLWGTTHADPDSIMGYQLPGEITRDGAPTLGGTALDDSAYALIATVYPKPDAVPQAPRGSAK